MRSSSVSRHRNSVVLYPFPSVGFGCSVMMAAGLIGRARLVTRAQRLVGAAIFVVAGVACAAATARSLPTSWKLATIRDTRSLAIDKINELAASMAESPISVGIVGELQFHRRSRTTDSPKGPLCSEPLMLHSIACDGTSLPKVTSWADLAGVKSTSTGWARPTPGHHAFVWSVYGTTRAGLPPQIRYTLRLRFGRVVALREGRTYRVPLFESPYAFRFEAPKGAEVSLSFERVQGGELSVQLVRTVDLPRAASLEVKRP